MVAERGNRATGSGRLAGFNHTTNRHVLVFSRGIANFVKAPAISEKRTRASQFRQSTPR
jgi:hypothetical protein